MKNNPHTGYPQLEVCTIEDLELSEDSETKLTVQGVSVANSLQIISGPTKCNKTNIAVDYAISVATGESFLGVFSVITSGRTLGIFAENRKASIYDRVCRIADSKELWSSDLGGSLDFSFEAPDLTDWRVVSGLKGLIRAEQYKNVIIDPTYLCLPSRRGNSLLAMGNVLQPIKRMCEELEVTISLVHHTRKHSTGKTNLSIDAMAGAGFSEVARQWILIDRVGEFDPQDFRGRHELIVKCGGEHGHGSHFKLFIEEGHVRNPEGRTWHTEVEWIFPGQSGKPQQIQSRQEIENTMQQILSYLKSKTEGDTKRGIRDATKLENTALNEGIRQLTNDGKVEACHVQKSNRSYAGFRLVV